QVLVGHVSGSADLEWVRGQVARTLPEYMVPAVMVDVARWPLSPNGKLDRSALPTPDFHIRTGQGEQPHNEREQAICDAFTTVLALDRVRVDDDFFRLGGDSEPFSSCFSELKHEHGTSDLAGAVGAAA